MPCHLINKFQHRAYLIRAGGGDSEDGGVNGGDHHVEKVASDEVTRNLGQTATFTEDLASQDDGSRASLGEDLRSNLADE